MKRLAGTLMLLPILLLGAGCRGESAGQPGVEQQFSDVEATLDVIESEMAGD